MNIWHRMAMSAMNGNNRLNAWVGAWSHAFSLLFPFMLTMTGHLRDR